MKHIELLRPILLQGLLHTDMSADACDFKKWISTGKYIVREIPSSKTVNIEINNEHAFNHMVTYDSCRMACASFETMNNIQSIASLPKSFGWIAIKSYYAAFFSAHSIMRYFGYNCSQLERGHVTQLNDYAQAVGLTNLIRPDAGFFVGEYDQLNRSLSLKKMKNTHEDTWNAFKECLYQISLNVLNVSGLTSQKQGISASIDDLIYRLTDEGRLAKGNYLSQYRNAVNYRHEHDAWHPYGKQSIKAKKIVDILSTWRQVDNVSSAVWKESVDSYNFFLTCRDVVNLNYQLMNLIIENSENVSNMYKLWPNKLMNISKVA